jgi:hypothetical protein
MSKQSELIKEIRKTLGDDSLKLNPSIVISNVEKIRWQVETVTAVNVQAVKYFRTHMEDTATIDLDILETPVLAEILRQLKEYA